MTADRCPSTAYSRSVSSFGVFAAGVPGGTGAAGVKTYPSGAPLRAVSSTLGFAARPPQPGSPSAAADAGTTAAAIATTVTASARPEKITSRLWRAARARTGREAST
jgi:hypothetical protein